MNDDAAHAATANWQAMALAAATSLAIAASFVYAALTVRGTPSDDWMWGLAALVPLEFVRAIVLQTLGDAFKDFHSPKHAVRKFLASIGSLVLIGIVWSMFNIGVGAPFALLANARAQQLLGIPALVLVAECAVALYFFRGDARSEAARTQAVADDAYDWVFLATFYLPPLLIVAFICAMLKWRAAELEAWFNSSEPDLTVLLPPLLFYGAVYFCGKAAVQAYVHTVQFCRTGKRLLGAGWIQSLLLRSREDRAKEASNASYRKHALEHELVRTAPIATHAGQKEAGT